MIENPQDPRLDTEHTQNTNLKETKVEESNTLHDKTEDKFDNVFATDKAQDQCIRIKEKNIQQDIVHTGNIQQNLIKSELNDLFESDNENNEKKEREKGKEREKQLPKEKKNFHEASFPYDANKVEDDSFPEEKDEEYLNRQRKDSDDRSFPQGREKENYPNIFEADERGGGNFKKDTPTNNNNFFWHNRNPLYQQYDPQSQKRGPNPAYMPFNYYPMGYYPPPYVPSGQYFQNQVYQGSPVYNIPNRGNDIYSSQLEVMQMKVLISNIESENMALKEKLKEYQGGKRRYGKASENKEAGSPKYENTSKNNNKYDPKIKENSEKEEMKLLAEKIEKYTKELDTAYKELHKREETLKRSVEEKEKIKSYLDTMKRENQLMKSLLEKKENEIVTMADKLEETENNLSVASKKLQIEQNNFKSIREDYDVLNKKFHSLKKQNEVLLNSAEDVKEENFILKQDNEKLNKKITNSILVQEHYRELSLERERKEKLSSRKIPSNSNREKEKERRDMRPPEAIPNRGRIQTEYEHRNVVKHSISPEDKNVRKLTSSMQRVSNREYERYKSASAENQKEKDERVHNYDYFFPSEAFIRDSKMLIKAYQQNISELLATKVTLQNELFKIPEKQKSVNQIKNKRSLEERLDSVEDEINNYKIKIREIKKNLF